MKLLSISYPELSTDSFDRIEYYRKTHDKLYKIAKPHFTLVFSLEDFSTADFTTEIKKQLTGLKSFSFCISNAIINKDAFSETYHTFLVPDKGHNEIVKLHDTLYSDQLSKHLRNNIEYIPHITICRSTDKTICQELADEWNSNHFQIKGVISSVDIVSFENDVVATVEKIRLVDL